MNGTRIFDRKVNWNNVRSN